MEVSLQLQQVEKELLAMKVLYPHCGHTAAGIKAIARIYWQDCTNEGMGAKDFLDACSLARRDNKMFPSVGDVVRAHRALMAGVRPTQSLIPLPPVMTDEKRDLDLGKCREILAMLKNYQPKRVPLNRGERTR
ncbi:hypothetical protein D0S45_17485 [Marinifilum sp. JC120]|nr:hypothetical protein D0S45_17485 [Marinifilum sp. JC120]